MKVQRSITNTISNSSHQHSRILTWQRLFVIGVIIAIYIGTMYRAVHLPYTPPSGHDLINNDGIIVDDDGNITIPSDHYDYSPPLNSNNNQENNHNNNNNQNSNNNNNDNNHNTIPSNPDQINNPDPDNNKNTPIPPPIPPIVNSVYKKLHFKDYAFMAITHAIFFSIGWWFFTWKINADVERLFNVVILFCTTFAISSAMFVLILAEILDAFQTYTRWASWKHNLSMLLTIIIVLLPVSFLVEVVPRTLGIITRSIIVLISYTIFFYFTVMFRNPLSTYNPAYAMYPMLSIENVVSRVSILGVTSIALLSGFGAINMPHQYLVLLMRPINDADMILYHRHWNQVLGQIANIKSKILLLDLQVYFQRVIDHKQQYPQLHQGVNDEYNNNNNNNNMNHFGDNNNNNNNDNNPNNIHGNNNYNNSPSDMNNNNSIDDHSPSGRKQSKAIENCMEMAQRRTIDRFRSANNNNNPNNQQQLPYIVNQNGGLSSEMATYDDVFDDNIIPGPHNNIHPSMMSHYRQNTHNINTIPIPSILPHQNNYPTIPISTGIIAAAGGVGSIGIAGVAGAVKPSRQSTLATLRSNDQITHSIQHNDNNDQLSTPSQSRQHLLQDYNQNNDQNKQLNHQKKSLLQSIIHNNDRHSLYDTQHHHILPCRILGSSHRTGVINKNFTSHAQQLSLILPKDSSLKNSQYHNTNDVNFQGASGQTSQPEVDTADIVLAQGLPSNHPYNPRNRPNIMARRRVHNLIGSSNHNNNNDNNNYYQNNMNNNHYQNNMNNNDYQSNMNNNNYQNNNYNNNNFNYNKNNYNNSIGLSMNPLSNSMSSVPHHNNHRVASLSMSTSINMEQFDDFPFKNAFDDRFNNNHNGNMNKNIDMNNNHYTNKNNFNNNNNNKVHQSYHHHHQQHGPSSSLFTRTLQQRRHTMRTKRFSPWNFFLYPFHWVIRFWTLVYNILLSLCGINICLRKFFGSNNHLNNNIINNELIDEIEYHNRKNNNNNQYGPSSGGGGSGGTTTTATNLCNQTILTPYQIHLIELDESLDRQRALQKDPSLAMLANNNNTANSSVLSSTSTSMTSNLISMIEKKRQQLEMQLSIQVDIQRRISTDLYQLTFEHQHYTKQTNTLLGKVQNLASYFLAIFGIGKVLLTIKNLVFGRGGGNISDGTGAGTQQIDIPTRFLTFLLTYIFNVKSITPHDIKWWITIISLIFLGGLVMTQMRGFLINFTKIFRTFSLFISPVAMLYVFTTIMGIYFVSMVLLSRVHLPSSYRRAITHVLGHLEFQFYHRWFDVIFLISAITTFCLFYLFRKMRPTNDTLNDGY